MRRAVGFYSYARADDTGPIEGAATALRAALQTWVRAGVPGFELFQDTEGIQPGDPWKERLDDKLHASVVFFPVLSPAFFASEWCRAEAEAFFRRVDAGADLLIVPLYAFHDGKFESAVLRKKDPLRDRIRDTQYADLREHWAARWEGAALERVKGVARLVGDAHTRAEEDAELALEARALLGTGDDAGAWAYLAEHRAEEAEKVRAGRPVRGEIGRVYAEIVAARGVREAAERVRAEREARERVEREAREKAEREAREKAEREAREKAEREAQQRSQRARAQALAEATRPGARSTIRLGSVDLPLAYVPAGSFRMGSPEGLGDNDERPQHEVRITRPFRMGVTPVTQAQWASVAKAAGLDPDPSRFKGATRPVEQVSFYDAVRWCNAASRAAGLSEAYRVGAGAEPSVERVEGAPGFRLPTEAEWEYACRAGTSTAYWFGDAEGMLGEHGWFDGNAGGETHPVGEKAANAWGLHDVHGNVWEWCEDGWRRTYAASPAVDPVHPGAVVRVVRGGSWSDSAGGCRSAWRSSRVADGRNGVRGFRVVVAAPAPQPEVGS